MNFVLSRIDVCRYLGFLACLSLIAGCSGSNYPTMYPVSGVITMDDKPLANAQLAFVPVNDEEGGFTGVGVAESNEQGQFEVYMADYTGLPEGVYKVTVSAEIQIDDNDEEEGEGEMESVVPPIYESEDTTPLQIEVQAIDKNEISLKVERK